MDAVITGKGYVDISGLPFVAGDGTEDRLYIALSVKASEYPERLTWAQDQGFALEYTPDPLKPELIAEHVDSYIADGTRVRFHTRFFDFELGNETDEKAREALTVHKQVVDAIQNLGERTVTIHLNLNKSIPFSQAVAVRNLVELTAYAREKGVTVCLENLKKGPSSIPDNIVEWAGQAGSKITMDLGHAVSSDHVQTGKASVVQVVDAFAPKLHEVHMYGKEEDRHYPIEDMKNYTAPIDRLLSTGCRWWTIELDDYTEALQTRNLLMQYLNTLRKD